MNMTCLGLVGETLVSVERRGQQRLDFIANTDKIENDQYIDIELLVKGMYGSFIKATKLWYRGELETCTVHAERNYEITCTLNHEILVVDEQDTRWVKAKDLTPNDHLVLDVTNCHKEKLLPELTSVFTQLWPMRFIRHTESEKQRVYDLSIEEGQAPAFVANGFLVRGLEDNQN